jgi:hypothetical protein
MNIFLIFVWIYAAMVAMAFWESYVEGRNAWDKKKLGWKLKIGSYFVVSAYHFYLAWIMIPLLVLLPLVIYGWDSRLFGILFSAYISGLVVEDFMWYAVNPVVKFREFWSAFSDYYPWIKIGGKKIIPVGYLLGIILAMASWYYLWR